MPMFKLTAVQVNMEVHLQPQVHPLHPLATPVIVYDLMCTDSRMHFAKHAPVTRYCLLRLFVKRTLHARCNNITVAEAFLGVLLIWPVIVQLQSTRGMNSISHLSRI